MYNEKAGYINRWPAWLDLEELVYRPVCCRLLPWLGGLVFTPLDRLISGRFVSGFLANVCVTVFRAFDELVDKIVLFLRELLFINRSDITASAGTAYLSMSPVQLWTVFLPWRTLFAPIRRASAPFTTCATATR